MLGDLVPEVLFMLEDDVPAASALAIQFVLGGRQVVFIGPLEVELCLGEEPFAVAAPVFLQRVDS